MSYGLRHFWHFGLKTPVVNLQAIGRMLGWLLLIEAAFMLIPLATSLVYGEEDWVSFLWGIAVTVGAGMLAIGCFRPRVHSMGKREGFLLTAVVWVVFSLFGMIPLMVSATAPLSVSEAFFEAMSGFTTTGATVINEVTTLSRGIIMWRCVMQWLGGMGIIMFTLAVLPKFNHSGGLMMFNAEVTGITHDKLRPRISQTAKGLWLIYVMLSVLLILMLWCGPMNFFESVCHGFSTISTGGYSTENASLGAWDHSLYTKIVVTVFMFVGGVNFALIYATAQSGPKVLWRNDIFRTYVYSVLGMLVLFDIAIVLGGNYRTLEDITIEPLFQIVSTITSTGYTVTNFEAWGFTVLVLVFVLMFVGASAGSTSGGAKLDRIRCVVLSMVHQLKQVINPRSVHTVRLNGRVIPQETVSKIMAFMTIYMLTIFVSAILLTAMDVPLVDAFFSTFSCMGNNGLGAGITGYGSNYDIIPDAGKWILSIVMLIGRLEIFTVFVLFLPEFWRK